MVGIHGVFNERWHLPLSFGLLPGTSQVLYTDLFDTLAHLDRQSILLDYEIGMRNACSEIWPKAFLHPRKCYFHFMKALFKHLVDLGLRTEYDVEGSELRRYYKLITALTYVEYTWVGTWTSSPPPSYPLTPGISTMPPCCTFPDQRTSQRAGATDFTPCCHILIQQSGSF